MIKRLSFIAAALVFCTSLTGCGTYFNIGDSSYSCPGAKMGVVCKPVSDVYGMTNSRNTSVADQVLAEQARAEQKSGSAAHDANTPSPDAPLLGTKYAVAAQSGPVPVLEPAKVMRIWVAPWIDEKEDLNWPSYVFIEVTPKRWTFGGKPFNKQKPIVPMVADFKDADKTDKGEAPPAAPGLPPIK